MVKNVYDYEIADRIKTVCELSKKPISQIQKECKVGKHTIRNWIDGTCLPSSECLRLFCIHNNVSADWILGIKEANR
jgi:hypothetical protein